MTVTNANANQASLTNTFSPNTKAKSSEVNTNFTNLVNALNAGGIDPAFGAIFLNYSNKTEDYTILDNDGVSFIRMTTSTTNRTVTLPLAANNGGRYIVVKKVDTGSGKVIIDGNGSETINQKTTVALYVQDDQVILWCNGVSWDRIDSGNHRIIRQDASGFSFTFSSSDVNTGTDTITEVAHGLENGDTVYISSVSAPGGLDAGRNYFVVNKTDDTFQLALTSGGSAVNITSGGSGTMTFNKNHHVSLPDLSDNTYRDLTIVRTNSSFIRILIFPASGQDINGLAFYTLANEDDSVTFKESPDSTTTWTVSNAENNVTSNTVRLHTGNGSGSTGVRVATFSGGSTSSPALQASIDTTNGDSITVLQPGLYSVSLTLGRNTGGTLIMGVSKNASSTTTITSLTESELICTSAQVAALTNGLAHCSNTVFLNYGDILKPHHDGGFSDTSVRSKFEVRQISKDHVDNS